MPPPVATVLTLGFVIFLFRRDIREKPDVSGALWLPLLWLVIGCSRPVSEWLNIFGLPVSGAASVEEGSPLDAWFFFALIIAGFCVLIKRQVRLSEVVSNNGWLIVFLLYCFISITWSDFPFVAFKRWIKILGHPIMALIVLTEPNPKRSANQLDEAMRLCRRPGFHSLHQILSSIGTGFQRVGRGRESAASPRAKTRWVQIA